MKQFLCMLLFGSMLFSCQGILEKDPIATLDAGSFFQSEQDAVQAINAAYRPLLFNNENNNFYWAFSTITSDEAVTGGDGSRAGLVELEAFTYTPRTEEFNTFWKLQYTGIMQCNLVLDNLPKADMTETRRNQIAGEALFLRSYYYFLLVQVFGDVPLFTNITPPEQHKIPKTAKADLLARIEADCERAAEFLPVQRPAAEAGRPTRGSALALAAKAGLYGQKWQKVVDYVGRIKALNVYRLMADYQDNFKKETQNNAESVWEIQHTNLELGVGNFLNQWLMSRKLLGYGFAEVTPGFVNAFEAGDPRRRFTIASRDEPYFGSIFKNSFSSTTFSPRKYLQDIKAVTQPADGDINYTAIRFAEVLLWEAEALNELGRVADAQARWSRCVHVRVRNPLRQLLPCPGLSPPIRKPCDRRSDKNGWWNSVLNFTAFLTWYDGESPLRYCRDSRQASTKFSPFPKRKLT